MMRGRDGVFWALRSGFGKRGWVIPNERAKTGRSARKGPSRRVWPEMPYPDQIVPRP